MADFETPTSTPLFSTCAADEPPPPTISNHDEQVSSVAETENKINSLNSASKELKQQSVGDVIDLSAVDSPEPVPEPLSSGSEVSTCSELPEDEGKKHTKTFKEPPN